MNGNEDALWKAISDALISALGWKGLIAAIVLIIAGVLAKRAGVSILAWWKSLPPAEPVDPNNVGGDPNIPQPGLGDCGPNGEPPGTPGSPGGEGPMPTPGDGTGAGGG